MRPIHSPIVRRCGVRIVILAVFLVMACDGGDDADLTIGYSANGAYAHASLFRATIHQRGMPRVIDGPSMQKYVDEPGAIIAGRSHIPLRAGDEVTVEISLDTPSGPSVGRVAWTPQKDWDYGVSVVVDTLRPEGICFNVVQAIALPATSATADTLFIAQLGLPKNAIC